ncbi:hypothetical protein DWU98_10240 [Dyella monticola]|uniref:Uncharacterized protein n=1 Tax=Dyella monticola TaxID=1927958 RepID=A0A370X009_9GAMM|nr:hypothetical protein [Dyella monticola]RDS81601.1 hypothetical protein DWU98_10240 [Dyella monticola]
MKRLAFFLTLLAAPLAIAPFGKAGAQSRNWQQSTDSQTQLWVRDKNQGAPYQATFIVVEPNGKSIIRAIRSGSGGAASATFPKDFGVFPPLPVGKYHWSAKVNDKIAASDDFNR